MTQAVSFQDIQANTTNQNGIHADGQNSPHYREMPHNLEAEQGLLGALLVNNGSYEKIGDLLRTEHFYHPVHQRIFTAISQFIDRGQSASPVTLKGYFEKDKDLEDLGKAGYLADLAASVVSVINVKDYAETIHELALRRALVNLGEDIVNEAHDLKLDGHATSTIEMAESKLFALAESGDISSKGFVSLRDSVLVSIEIAEKAFKTQGGVTGVTTGLRDMDKQLSGLHPSDLIILAGRPSMGKTALATNIAYNAAARYAETGGKEGGRVGFFSLEMSSDQLATRILADVANISGHAIKKGNIKENDFQAFVQASQKLSQVPLYIDDTPSLTIGAVRTRARRLKRQHGLDLLVIDYLQLLRGTGSRQSTENRVLEISEITRGLKAIAKELEIPVLALSQLSRNVEQREDKRPLLSDLRESGSIEQDSDVVMFVYREEYYLSRTEPEVGTDKHLQWQERMDRAHNIGECIVSKARHGPIGTIRMHFDPHVTRFSDLDEHHTNVFD
ncbi:MAG: replicative DNA helicase [Alphaproteobacteria bacterium]|nr:replicative DNA helicase [Alphaproteobacteria bacterium]